MTGVLKCNGDHGNDSACCYCTRGFLVALPAIFVPRSREWHNVCPMCIRHHFSGPTMYEVRQMLRILILGHEPTKQGRLT